MEKGIMVIGKFFITCLLSEETNTNFAIDPAAKEVRYILKAMFDGVAVFLPADPEKYLQKRYGENLAPAKVYNPMTNKYEKDLTHPYWSRPFVH